MGIKDNGYNNMTAALKTSIIIAVLMLCMVPVTAGAGGTATPAIQGGGTPARPQAGKKQVLDESVRAIVERVKALASQFVMSREEAKADKRFVSEERTGTSWFVDLVREGVKITLIYDDYRSILAEATIEDKQGRKKFIFYSDDGQVSQYSEAKGRMFDGVELDFYKNGMLERLVEFKENRLLGRQMEWDESGELIKSVINDGSRKIKEDDFSC